MEKYPSRIYFETLYFKPWQLPGEGGWVSSSSLASPRASSAAKAALSSSCTLCCEWDEPCPTSTTVNGNFFCNFFCIPTANNKKINFPIVNIRCYINNQCVNYLGVLSEHHKHPLLVAVQYGRLPSSPPPSIVKVRDLRQLLQLAVDVSSPFLRPKTLPHRETVNYRQHKNLYTM